MTNTTCKHCKATIARVYKWGSYILPAGSVAASDKHRVVRVYCSSICFDAGAPVRESEIAAADLALSGNPFAA